MLAEGLIALAQWAGQTVAAAAVTDVWEAARQKVARLLGRGDPKKTEAAERWLDETHQQLTAAQGADLELARAAVARRWEGRFADLLDEDPGAEADLRAVVEEIAAQLPAGVVSAADHSVAAGRDVNITASGGGTAAGVIHGNVAPPGPTLPGPANSLAEPGIWIIEPGAVVAIGPGVAVGPRCSYLSSGQLPASRCGWRPGRRRWPGGRSCWRSWMPGCRPVMVPRRGWWRCTGWEARGRPAWRWSTRTVTWLRSGWRGSFPPRTPRCWRPGSASWPPSSAPGTWPMPGTRWRRCTRCWPSSRRRGC